MDARLFMAKTKCTHNPRSDEGAMPWYRLEYLYIESSDNLWFERHFVSQTFHYYATFLFMRGENVGLLNRKNLNAILFYKLWTLYVATL